MASETITRNDLKAILDEVLPSKIYPDIRKASATISNQTCAVPFADGYTYSNTIVVGVEIARADNAVINVTGFSDLIQCRWNAARNGIYVLVNDTNFNGGTATIYYMKISK